MAITRRVHPLVWAACTAMCGLLFLVSVLSYQAADREIPPGTDAVVQVQQVAMSEADALAALQQTADAQHVNLLLVGSNPAGPDAPPWYFAFVGDRKLFDRTFPGGTYPSFSPRAVPKIFAGAEIAAKAQPILGTYALQGNDTDRFAIGDSLTDAGFDVTTDPVNPVRSYLSGLFASVTWPVLITAAVALALAIVYSTGLGRKAAALQQFHGWRASRVVRGQLADLATAYASSAIAVTAVGVGVLLLYNRGHQLADFAPWALLPIGAAGVVALLVQLTASWASLALPAYAALKGARPVRLLALTAGLSQIVMLALVFSAIAQAADAIVSINRDSRSFAEWDSERGSVVVQVNPNAFEDPRASAFEPDVAAAYASFGRIFTQLDADGSAVLSFHQAGNDSAVAGTALTDYEPLGANSLIVNNNYLSQHPINDAAGRAITAIPPEPGTISLLIPERLARKSAELAQRYATTRLAAWDPIEENEPVADYRVKTRLIADDQAIFNYGDTWQMKNWAQKDPVVAVVSPQSRYISDWVLLSGAANGGNVIFSDAKKFHRLADEAGLTKRFSGINSPATNAAQRLHERNTEMIVAVGNATAGCLALLIALTLLASIYADAVRFSSFLKATHGWSAVRIHWPFVVITACLSSTVIIAAGVALRPAGLAATPTMQATAAALSGVVAVVTVAATASLDRRARAALITSR